MAIDIGREDTFPLGQAPDRARVPGRRGGRKPAISTFFRWATRGIRGVRLETIQVGGTRCTSQEAIQRFFDRLTATADAGRRLPPPRRPDPRGVDRELDALLGPCPSAPDRSRTPAGTGKLGPGGQEG